MRLATRTAAAVVAVIAVAAVGRIATSRPSTPAATMQAPNANEIDIDLAAGTPMPALPTVLPENESVVTAEQALAHGLRGAFHRPIPKSISVRLLNQGILNRLCGGDSGSMPEDELVWAVAFTQDGLTTKEIAGPFYDRQLPPGILGTADPLRPTPTARLTPTPVPVAGAVIVIVAGKGYINRELELFPADGEGSHCPTFEMIRGLRSFPDILEPLPTEPPHTPIPTEQPLMDPISSTVGITLTDRTIKVTIEATSTGSTPTP